jgi:pyruvate/2-oxoglutarate/acetoin dehydrogenase E1 component
VVPEEEFLVPLGVADVKRAGNDITLVGWGPAIPDALQAAERLQSELGASAEVVDIRSLIPLDQETILASVQKTGRCVVVSQSVTVGSFMGEVVTTIQENVFDYLDAPIMRVGAKNGIAPQSHVLEAVFLPNANDIFQAARSIL